MESLPLPTVTGPFANFEDVGISSDGQLAILTGGDPPSEAPVFIRPPFTAAGAQSYYVPLQGTGRNRGAVRFQPPCPSGNPTPTPGVTPTPGPTPTPGTTPTPGPTPTPGGPPGLTADYQFQNTRNSSGGGPALTDIVTAPNGANSFVTESVDGCAPRSVLNFSKGNGLTLVPTTGLTTDNKTYTIAMLFKFAEQGGYRAIVDFKNGLQFNRGVYANDLNNLQFINSTSDAVGVGVGTGSPITANKYVQVVLTRQGSDANAGRAGIETGYVDGELEYRLDHANDDGVIHPQFDMLPLL